jgi:hypothetical protein
MAIDTKPLDGAEPREKVLPINPRSQAPNHSAIARSSHRRNLQQHIGIVFSRELYRVGPNLVLCLMSESNKRHPFQLQKADGRCGICSLFACHPKASFLDARLFLEGWLSADGYGLAEVRDIRDFCSGKQAPHVCGH